MSDTQAESEERHGQSRYEAKMEELLNRLAIIETAFTLAVRTIGIIGAALLVWFLVWAWIRGRR